MSILTRFDCVLKNSESVQVIEFVSVIVVEQGIDSPNFNSNQCPPTPCGNFVVEKIQVSRMKKYKMLFMNRLRFSSCCWLKKNPDLLMFSRNIVLPT